VFEAAHPLWQASQCDAQALDQPPDPVLRATSVARFARTFGHLNRAASPHPHQAYFAAAADEALPHLQRISAKVEQLLPEASACISYGMPAYRLGRIFFYFAAFKKHIGVYPPVKGNRALQARLRPFRGPKGNLIFPLAQPVPYDLIGDVAVALASEYAGPPAVARRKGAT
jgi:uncharacterized protein YdhG (YjbR/CyaY superfamily)